MGLEMKDFKASLKPLLVSWNNKTLIYESAQFIPFTYIET